MRRFGLIAAVPLAALLFTGSVAAQTATPSADNTDTSSRALSPQDCTGQPMAADALITAATTKPAAPTYKLSIPLGEATDAKMRNDVSDAIRAFMSCLNGNDNARAASYLTPTGIFLVYGATASNPQTAATFKESLGKKPTARTAEQSLRLLSVTDVVDLGDNYVAALVAVNDPTTLPRGPQTLLMVLHNDNGAFKIDNIIAFTKVVPPTGTPTASPAAS
jgi:hypothetical protein